ncbi:SMI1/KNR4 family protein [Chitinophaga filiformis]|uniref:SMI1 / KNR4 family (SUKH-1) n=1 Tax=Chitinophaga filiformis TaxID=104663 RepID=A0A1G7MGZ8_CHIFI|nr:SMI1/KNR4 family protein [Chitinophaga filiformis]SDF61138.1 SMI1 / KNR4 family (SUKH-1) [Chitinophaga filiformis]
MNEHITKYIQDLTLNSSIDGTKFSEIIDSIDCNFPDDYLDFLRETNGGVGFIRDGKYVHFWRAEELIKFNDGFDEFLPDFFLIGSDGGGTGFAIRRKEGTFVSFPFIGADEDTIENVGKVFREFLAYLSLPWKEDDEDEYEQQDY